MAETVQYYLERMVPELEDLEQKRLFNKVSIGKSIVFCLKYLADLIETS